MAFCCVTCSVIQWETATFFTYESEINGLPVPFGDPIPDYTRMSVGITRLGSSEGEARVKWQTFDMSAKAGVHYKEVKPTEVVFKNGENHKEVILDVIPSDSFDGTVELGL